MVKTKQTLQKHRDVKSYCVFGGSEPIKCGWVQAHQDKQGWDSDKLSEDISWVKYHGTERRHQ